VSDREASRVRLRAMEGRDAPVVAALSGQLGYPSTPEEIEHRLHGASRDPESALLVAEGGDGRVVGWTHVIGRHFLESEPFAEIVGLVVDAGARRLGVGRALATGAESWARARGYAAIRVRSNTARDESRPFYLGIGYETIKTQYVYRKKLG
jgi:GNAT superfamily N-acetyltransferase